LTAETPAALRARLEREGRIWLCGALAERDLDHLEALADDEGRPGARVPASGPAIRALRDGALAQAIRQLMPDAEPARIVAFNKSPGANWGVPWHQDRVIAVRERSEAAGFGAWSWKSGVWHCEPPTALLERMLFVRVHLDDADAANGAMQIALGSHKQGRVEAARAEAVAVDHPREMCAGRRGDVLVLKMLTLHCSRRSTSDAPRRALRIDYAPAGLLPAGLAWA